MHTLPNTKFGIDPPLYYLIGTCLHTSAVNAALLLWQYYNSITVQYAVEIFVWFGRLVGGPLCAPLLMGEHE